uniref:Uncharacterized protein n=1 Tax=Rhizophora mucronata TaxID=61149 RepID=A0A2P2QV32_RHIMU
MKKRRHIFLLPLPNPHPHSFMRLLNENKTGSSNQ